MRKPSTVFRGVLVFMTIVGVFLLTNVNSAQSSDIVRPRSLDFEAVELPAPEEEQSSITQLNLPFVNNQIVQLFDQGFDKCSPPSVEDMQRWWNYSPYKTFNIYLGGISLHCPHNLIIPNLPQLDQMGWRFILTWAGPQAPKGCPDNCKFKYPISLDPDEAYEEGKQEAEAAVAAAASFGFKGPFVIYYDMESYSDIEEGDPVRIAAAAFLEGWVEQIHSYSQGHKAGAYGSSCTSYIMDWTENVPPPDDIWIAYWNKKYEYDPYASVWNIPCLPNGFWADNQRLRQYTGGHDETWDDVTFTIDSDVILGQVNTLYEGIVTPQATILSTEGALSQFKQFSTMQPLQSMQLLSADTGWVLQGEHLLWTEDSGSSWRDISPVKSGGEIEMLTAAFLDTKQGWLVQRVYDQARPPTIIVSRTADGGMSWQETTLPGGSAEQVMQVESATIEQLDEDHLWIAFKLHSSSNFSFGSLFATQDGGLTWQARSLPLGEPVKFTDSQHGWMAGGPTGDQLFNTEDGGRTWSDQTQDLELPDSSGPINIGLPLILRDGSLILPVFIENDQLLYSTSDGGGSWRPVETRQLNLGSDQARQAALDLLPDLQILTGTAPQGVMALDVFDDQHAWALTHNGSCSGFKSPSGETPPPDLPAFHCSSNNQLFETNDGGLSWFEITPIE